MSFRRAVASLLLLALAAACQPREDSDVYTSPGQDVPDYKPDLHDPADGTVAVGPTDAALFDSSLADSAADVRVDVPEPDLGPPDVGSGDAAPATPVAMTIGTWNLRNFSQWGVEEFRLPAIAAKIAGSGADILGLQEIKPADMTMGEGPQAWDALVESLDAYEGVKAPWNTPDTNVALIYRKDRVRVLSSKTIYANDGWPFPRPPLVVTAEIGTAPDVVEVRVVVLHLKAFGDSESQGRRREAVEKLRGWIEGQPPAHWVIVGDLNDDPYDTDSDNIFDGHFLGNEPTWFFVTAALPQTSSTSTGWYHWVGDEKITGELIDHVIVSGGLDAAYSAMTPEILAVPRAEFEAWQDDYSDHFPVVVHFEP